MDTLTGLGLGASPPSPPAGAQTTHVVVQQPLRRVLAFTGHSIDDIVNDPIAKQIVLGYYRLYRYIERRSDVLDLERQWNPLGMSA
jgi:hypothetical protein